MAHHSLIYALIEISASVNSYIFAVKSSLNVHTSEKETHAVALSTMYYRV